jgi:hypothetical protein
MIRQLFISGMLLLAPAAVRATQAVRAGRYTVVAPEEVAALGFS